jgi:hypothetical protein
MEYIRVRLRKLGMAKVKFLPSKMLIKSQRKRMINKIFYLSCAIIRYGTFGRLILTPSLLVIAQKASSKIAAAA